MTLKAYVSAILAASAIYFLLAVVLLAPGAKGAERHHATAPHAHTDRAPNISGQITVTTRQFRRGGSGEVIWYTTSRRMTPVINEPTPQPLLDALALPEGSRARFMAEMCRGMAAAADQLACFGAR